MSFTHKLRSSAYCTNVEFKTNHRTNIYFRHLPNQTAE